MVEDKKDTITDESIDGEYDDRDIHSLLEEKNKKFKTLFNDGNEAEAIVEKNERENNEAESDLNVSGSYVINEINYKIDDNLVEVNDYSSLSLLSAEIEYLTKDKINLKNESLTDIENRLMLTLEPDKNPSCDEFLQFDLDMM